jgi:hypothetical protein
MIHGLIGFQNCGCGSLMDVLKALSPKPTDGWISKLPPSYRLAYYWVGYGNNESLGSVRCPPPVQKSELIFPLLSEKLRGHPWAWMFATNEYTNWGPQK